MAHQNEATVRLIFRIALPSNREAERGRDDQRGIGYRMSLPEDKETEYASCWKQETEQEEQMQEE